MIFVYCILFVCIGLSVIQFRYKLPCFRREFMVNFVITKKIMMSDSPNIIRKCSVTMMMSLYSDVINIVAGALLNFAHIYGILLSIGYIILHLVSIGYLLFYRKLGFRYHLKTSRILILFPQIFLLINSIGKENPFLHLQ